MSLSNNSFLIDVSFWFIMKVIPTLCGLLLALSVAKGQGVSAGVTSAEEFTLGFSIPTYRLWSGTKNLAIDVGFYLGEKEVYDAYVDNSVLRSSNGLLLNDEPVDVEHSIENIARAGLTYGNRSLFGAGMVVAMHKETRSQQGMSVDNKKIDSSLYVTAGYNFSNWKIQGLYNFGKENSFAEVVVTLSL